MAFLCNFLPPEKRGEFAPKVEFTSANFQQRLLDRDTLAFLVEFARFHVYPPESETRFLQGEFLQQSLEERPWSVTGKLSLSAYNELILDFRGRGGPERLIAWAQAAT